MTNTPKLAEAAVRKRTGDRSFGLGRSYFEHGVIHAARKQGNMLKARCSGSRGEAYRVHATFDAKGVASAEKTRPQEALEIYRARAERAIKTSGGDYTDAVDALKKVRALYTKLGESDLWARYVAEVRERERRRRNLMKELDTARM